MVFGNVNARLFIIVPILFAFPAFFLLSADGGDGASAISASVSTSSTLSDSPSRPAAGDTPSKSSSGSGTISQSSGPGSISGGPSVRPGASISQVQINPLTGRPSIFVSRVDVIMAEILNRTHSLNITPGKSKNLTISPSANLSIHIVSLNITINKSKNLSLVHAANISIHVLNNKTVQNDTNGTALRLLGLAVPAISYQTAFVNATTGHSFTATAGVSDADGAADIFSTNISSPNCVYLSDATDGVNEYNVTYNCTGTAPAAETIIIGFTDTSANYADTTPAGNDYPDNAPSITQPTITPATAYINDTLNCTNGAFSDIDNDTENASSQAWAWYNNGVLMAGETAQTLAPGSFIAGDNISCAEQVYANNWNATSAANVSAEITISGSAPAISYQITFINATTGHSFTATAGVTDMDGASDIVAVNVSSPNCAYLSNVTSGNDLNVTYNCTSSVPAAETVAIGFTDSAANYADTTPASNDYPDNAPTLSQPTVTPATSYVNDTLNCNNGIFSDIDSDTENASSITYAWYLNGVLIVGQTAQTLAPGSFIAGDNVSCEQTVYSNDWPLSATNISNNTTISGSAPFIAYQLSFVNASVGHSFTATAGITDMDGATDIVATNTTAANCVYLSNITSGNDLNVTYNCTSAVQATDTVIIGFTDSSANYIDTTPANNSYPDNAPSVTPPSITPSPAYVNDTLNCTNGVFSDIDGDTENPATTYDWFVNGVLVPGEFTQTLAPGFFVAGDNVSCIEGVWANSWPGAAYNVSSNITISGSAPFIAYQLSFVNASVGHSFTATAGITDMDGAADIVATNTTAANCVYLSSTTNGNDLNVTYNCTSTVPATETVIIGFTDSAANYIDTTPAANDYPDNAPTLTQPAITPSPAYISDTLNCTNGVFLDIDSDTENPASAVYDWYVNGAVVPGQNQQTLAPGFFVAGDNVSCQETVAAFSWLPTAVNASSNITIVNSAPTIAYQISFVNASTGHSFTATAGVADSDGAADIAATNISTTEGTCVYASNSTSGNDLNVTYNCTGIYTSTASVIIGFTDASANYTDTLPAANDYPDNAPALTQPTISPAPAYINDTLTCTNGIFSDIDSDTENVSSQAWAWYLNGAAMANQTNSTLTPGNFIAGDNISCEQTAYSDNWTAYGATNASNITTVSNSVPFIAYQLSFANESIGHSFNVSAGITDMDGAADIVSTNISFTEGACDYANNSTSGNGFNATYNCTGFFTSTPTIIIGFTDSFGNYNETSPVANAYPDNAPLFTNITVSPDPAYAITPSLFCNATFSDIDNDTENISSQAFTWYLNGTIIPGENQSTLGMGNYSKHDNISCDETVFSDNWTAYNATGSSPNLTINNSIPVVGFSFFDYPTGHEFNMTITVFDGDGYIDVNMSNITDLSYDFGNCSYLNNSTSGYSIYIYFNCTGNFTSTPTFNVNYTDMDNDTGFGAASHPYPDNAPLLSAPAITPHHPSYYYNVLFCNAAGNFSDIDNDTENALSRTWRWFRNGAVIINQTGQTLLPAQFALYDNVSCEETVYANYWIAYNASNMSVNVSISAPPPSNNGGGDPPYFSSSGGGSFSPSPSTSALAMPVLSMAFNCTSGALEVSAASQDGSPIEGLTVFLQNGIGLNATSVTDGNGIAVFTINHDGSYSMQTVATSAFESATRTYLLSLCEEEVAPANATPQPAAPAAPTTQAAQPQAPVEQGMFSNALFADFAGALSPSQNGTSTGTPASRLADAMAKHIGEVLILLAGLAAAAYFLYAYLSKKEVKGEKEAEPEAKGKEAKPEGAAKKTNFLQGKKGPIRPKAE